MLVAKHWQINFTTLALQMPPATRIPGPWICNVLERYGRKLGRIRLVKFLLQSATEFTFTEMTAVNWFKE
ncbi:hypothetical protein Y032_0027g1510 [Ancylostoma ceylanicum]|uniref:Uncharacterized protein n=1 Tax=Ancylostoma ceylanicum TaxID=53326 RepID=A0A016USL3_9BILA|nr:hypothetical protein Y032_0027g1510 [Ancylostoma ceylanicum]